jgi:hypothetical protein
MNAVVTLVNGRKMLVKESRSSVVAKLALSSNGLLTMYASPGIATKEITVYAPHVISVEDE